MKAAVKKLIGIFLGLLAVLLILTMGIYFLGRNYVFLNGKPVRRDSEQLSFFGEELPDLNALSQLQQLKELDLRNTTLTLGEHEWLQRQLPDCKIRWQILFQGRHYLPEEDRIRVTTLTEADIILLDFLPELREIDARDCRDYEALGQLMKKRPQCRVLTQAELGGELCTQDTEELVLRDADMKQLLNCLPGLPGIRRIRFTGNLPTTGELNRLRGAFPQIEADWQLELFGNIYEKNQEFLDFSLQEIPDAGWLREKLLYFPYVKTLDFRGVFMSPEDRELLETYYPQVEMIWDCRIREITVETGAQVLDLSGHPELTLSEIEEVLPYLPALKTIYLCDCGFPNEDLRAFNEKLPEIKVVWNVTVGGRNTRTDETYFTPNKWGLKMTDRNIYDLRYCTDMVCVDIGHSDKVTNCEWAAFMPELKYLILADSSVVGLEPLRNLKKLKYLELFLIPPQDLSPIQGCTALEDLNLCYVYTDPAPIGKMPWLKRVWWSGCWMASNQLPAALPDTELNFTSASSTGEGWREGKLYYEMRDFIGMGYMKG